jgi:GT2 family glycosyltransferase
MSPVPLNHVEPLHSNVWIVVLTWNNYADAAECLASLATIRYPNYCVLLVDNGSTDGTPERVRAAFPDVTLLQNSTNLGTPAGYNVGFRYALDRGADYVLMCHNDMTLDPDLVTHLVQADSVRQAGILVPIVYYQQRPEQVWSAGARYRRFPPAVVMEKRVFTPASGYHQLEYAIGCGILISRKAFVLAGFLDETYRFAYEDLDLSKRVREAGLLILQVRHAKAWHKVSRTTKPGSALFWEVFGESGVLYYRRHGTYWTMAVHLGYFALREFVIKGRLRALAPYIRGLRTGLARPLRQISHLEE